MEDRFDRYNYDYLCVNPVGHPSNQHRADLDDPTSRPEFDTIRLSGTSDSEYYQELLLATLHATISTKEDSKNHFTASYREEYLYWNLIDAGMNDQDAARLCMKVRDHFLQVQFDFKYRPVPWVRARDYKEIGQPKNADSRFCKLFIVPYFLIDCIVANDPNYRQTGDYTEQLERASRHFLKQVDPSWVDPNTVRGGAFKKDLGDAYNTLVPVATAYLGYKAVNALFPGLTHSK